VNVFHGDIQGNASGCFFPEHGVETYIDQVTPTFCTKKWHTGYTCPGRRSHQFGFFTPFLWSN